MSTPFYDLASLVLVPSGYKASKVYAQKPLTTDGQLTFSRASTATRVNASGLIETVASNVPRLDYQGATCGPRLLLEPQRSNVCLWSEQIDNAAWEFGGVTKTANDAISPDGYQNADKIEITSLSTPNLRQTIAVSAGTSYTFSFYAKSDDLSELKLAVYDLSNAVFIAENQIRAINSTWSRVSLTFTTPAGCTSIRAFIFRNSDSLGSFYAWGAMLEASSYVSSYIPSLGAAVTRLADACSKTGISSLIGQTEGTLFVEMKDLIWRGSAERLIGVSDGTTQNRIILVTGQTSNTLRVITTTGNVLQNSTTVASTFGDVKMAFAYSSAGGVVYVNGNQVLSFGGISVPACSAFYLQTQEDGSSFPADGKNAQALLFKTRLTNAQLAELTSL
jgi:hypothetical protein